MIENGKQKVVPAIVNEADLQELSEKYEGANQFVMNSWICRYNSTKARRDMAMSEVRKQENGMARILYKIGLKVSVIENGGSIDN